MLCVTKPILGDNYSVSLGNLFSSIMHRIHLFIHSFIKIHLVYIRRIIVNHHHEVHIWENMKQLLGSLKISFQKCFWIFLFNSAHLSRPVCVVIIFATDTFFPTSFAVLELQFSCCTALTYNARFITPIHSRPKSPFVVDHQLVCFHVCF